jgi:hypothetical protein
MPPLKSEVLNKHHYNQDHYLYNTNVQIGTVASLKAEYSN